MQSPPVGPVALQLCFNYPSRTSSISARNWKGAGGGEQKNKGRRGEVEGDGETGKQKDCLLLQRPMFFALQHADENGAGL